MLRVRIDIVAIIFCKLLASTMMHRLCRLHELAAPYYEWTNAGEGSFPKPMSRQWDFVVHPLALLVLNDDPSDQNKVGYWFGETLLALACFMHEC